MESRDGIFQDMSANYAEMFNFPPLTANIFTYLIFDFEQKGFTFEDILEATNASKSSVSNSLNRLLQTSHIEFICKIGDRRRFYRINKEIFQIQFQEQLNHLKKNKSILERFAQFRQSKVGEDIHAEKMRIHHKMLEETIRLHEETMDKMKEINEYHQSNE